MMAPTLVADPGLIDNGDMTRSVLWNFTDQSDYYLYNTTVSGGTGKLASTNESTGENTTAQYLLGTRTNVDVQTVPDTMMIDNASLTVQSITLQPGPADGYDNYIDEWFPSWPPTDGTDLRLNSQYDPDPVSSQRQRVLMQFNLSTVPAGAVIERATLSLYEKSGRAMPVDYTIHALTISWAEYGVSWRFRNLSDGWIWGGEFASDPFSWGTIDDTTGWHTFDLTRLVDLWVRNEIPNYGFIIVAKPGAADATKIFADCEITNKPEQRPRLMINYTLGEAAGIYESAALGPGTSSTFTLASWSNGTISKASDEFAGSSLSPKWDWTLDPSLYGGSIDFNPSGWLNLTGSQFTYLPNATEGPNFLSQSITGNFTAETVLDSQFTAADMGAGLMIMNDALTWLSIYLTGLPGSETIVAQMCKGDTRTTLGSIAWSGSAAFLRIERSGSDYLLLASTDGSSWTTVGSYAASLDFALSVSLGPFLFSGGSGLRGIVAFDYVRILPVGQDTAVDVSARTGNSTSLSDPSWGAWSAPLGPSNGAIVGSSGRYIQYRATLRTLSDWLSPSLAGFECHYERFVSNGTIVTGEVAPSSFQIWESMTVTQTLAGGDVEYLYSTDQGGSWTSLGFGSSFSLSISVPALMIRAELSTPDTSSTPEIDTIELVYRITHVGFYVAAPSMVQAGQLFTVYIEPKDVYNNTATWSGTVTLHAVDSGGIADATAELAVTQGLVPGGGQLLIANEQYNVSETIRITVAGGGATGISAPITITPGPPYAVRIEPRVTRLPQNSSAVFNASLCDEFGNNIPGAEFTWQADIGLGTLNATSGNSVNLTTVETESSGYLMATSGSLSDSMFIVVSALSLPPQIDPNIPVQTKPEDYGLWTLDLSPYVSDAEDNLTDLRWYTLNESLVKVSGENRTGDLIISFTTLQDMYGVDTLELWVVDSDRMSSKGTITVEITPVNDRPTIDPVDQIFVRFDEPYQYNLEFHIRDVDTPPASLSLWVDTISSNYVRISSLWLTFLYPQSLNGTQQTVFLSVHDGEYTASTVILVSVSDNRVPMALAPLPDQVMYQGDVKRDAFDLDEYFYDPDGASLYFTTSNVYVGVVIQPNHSVDFYAPNTWAGNEHIVFIAKDGHGARVESPLLMTVLAINHPPVIARVPDLVIRYAESYHFDLAPYIEDLDSDIGTLAVTVSDPRAWTLGTMLTLLFPSSMVGQRVPLNITVSDGALSDWWTINVTISSDNPPRLVAAAPDHSFLEDNPMPYPVLGYIDNFFSDPDGDSLTFAAFVSESNVSVEVVAAGQNWTIHFDPEENWYGYANLTFRATDHEGALAETTVLLSVRSVPDQPQLTLPERYVVMQGSRALLEVSKNVTDPDSGLTDFRWTMDSAYPDFISIHGGIIVFDMPGGFLQKGEKSRDIKIHVSVFDQDNLVSTDNMTITVTTNSVVPKQSPALWVGLFGSAGVAGLLAVYVISRRRKPFAIHDMMLIHNDGFLISRYAHHSEGEIDQDVLSGMLTAVLNFVEDSMATSPEGLKTFGFEEYQVLVHRGNKVFAAVVFEGDLPDDIDEPLKEFLDTIEKIYKKKLANWTGDIETDFAGIDVLIQGFVNEHSKRKISIGQSWVQKDRPSEPSAP